MRLQRVLAPISAPFPSIRRCQSDALGDVLAGNARGNLSPRSVSMSTHTAPNSTPLRGHMRESLTFVAVRWPHGGILGTDFEPEVFSRTMNE